MAEKLLKVRVKVHKSWPLNSLKMLSDENPGWLAKNAKGSELQLIGLGGLNKSIVWHKSSSK